MRSSPPTCSISLGPRAIREYDSTTSFIGQLAEALEDLSHGFEKLPRGKITLPKAFCDIRFLMTRYEPSNDLHQAMMGAFQQVFGERMAQHPIEMTRAVEQSGRFSRRFTRIDYRDMTRGTWRRARATFDQAYDEFKTHVLGRLGQAGGSGMSRKRRMFDIEIPPKSAKAFPAGKDWRQGNPSRLDGLGHCRDRRKHSATAPASRPRSAPKTTRWRRACAPEARGPDHRHDPAGGDRHA